jgi:hypothetical protein
MCIAITGAAGMGPASRGVPGTILTKAHFAGSAKRRRQSTGQPGKFPTRTQGTEGSPTEGFSVGLMESISEADLPLRKGVVCPIPYIYGPLSKVV